MTVELVHLHVHSSFSFGDGPDSPEELCAAAASDGQRALALTDTNGAYAAVRFVQAARAAGLRPILGTQLKTDLTRAVLLALDASGLRALFRQITARQEAGGSYDLARALEQCESGLAVLSDDPALLEHVRRTRGADELYAELWPRGRCPDARRQRLLALSAATGIPPIATGGVHFAGPEGHTRHRALRALALSCPMGNLPPAACAPEQAWLWPTARMVQGFSDHPEALVNAAVLAERCRAKLPLGVLLPPRPLFPSDPAGNGERAHPHPSHLPHTPQDAVTRLHGRCLAAAEARWSTPLPPAVRRRLDRELNLLATAGLSGALLAVGELARAAEAARIPLAARGSAAGSLVLHLLGVAPLEPLRYELGFSRFLEAGRATPPDIDIDVAWQGRARLMTLAKSRLGGRTLRAGRIVTLKLSDGQARRAGIPAHVAAALQGLPRKLGPHPSALALLPDPADQVIPAERVGTDAVLVSQWDARALRAAGLFVVDLLGSRSLAVAQTVSMILPEGGNGGPPPETPEEALDDVSTQALVRTGRTLGCYHLESPPMRALLRRLSTADFSTLMAASALIRPGAERAGLPDRLVRHARPEQAWRDRHRPFLVYQDDLFRLLRQRAALSREDADRLCAALRRGGTERLAAAQGKFVQACVDAGEAPADALALWEQVVTFAGASFCKAHCAASVALGVRCAWLRAHHPAAFLAAVLAEGGGYYPREAYVGEARRTGLTLAGPCVNRSGGTYQGAGGTIRLGLRQIRGLKDSTVASILDARQRDGPFTGEAELARRACLTPRDLDRLLRAGALPDVPPGPWSRASEMLPLRDPERRPPPADRTRLQGELDAFGFLLSAHPLDLVDDRLPPGLVEAAALDRYAGAPVALAGWLVSVKTIADRTGRPMEFATFEDRTDLFDALLDPEAHARFGGQLDRCPGPFVVYGRVAEAPGSRLLRLKDLKPL
ncbi:MAG: PHP domain-containing protein [bacterium]